MYRYLSLLLLLFSSVLPTVALSTHIQSSPAWSQVQPRSSRFSFMFTTRARYHRSWIAYILTRLINKRHLLLCSLQPRNNQAYLEYIIHVRALLAYKLRNINREGRRNVPDLLPAYYLFQYRQDDEIPICLLS